MCMKQISIRCSWYRIFLLLLHLWQVPSRIVYPTLLLMSDEAWFHLSDFVNAKNTCHWDTKNPHAVHKFHFVIKKVGVWCEGNGQRIIGTVFNLCHSELGALCEQNFETFLSNPHWKRKATCVFPAWYCSSPCITTLWKPFVKFLVKG
jgi:hypothetical protein